MADVDTSTAAVNRRVSHNRESAKLARAIPDQGEAMGYEYAALARENADLIEALLAERDAVIARAEQAEARVAELEGALKSLEKAATNFQENADLFLTETDYELDAGLAISNAELTIVALPAARAALSREGGE